MGRARQDPVQKVTDTQPSSLFLKHAAALAAVGWGVFLLLAVSSFEPSDQTPFTVLVPGHATAQQNIFGPVGALWADFLIQFMGLGAFVGAWIFCAHMLGYLRSSPPRSRFWLRMLGYPQFIICYLGLLSHLNPRWSFKETEFASGGILGNLAVETLSRYFGSSGSLLILILGCLVSLPLCLGVRPIAVLVYVMERLPSQGSRRAAKNLVESALTSPSSLSTQSVPDTTLPNHTTARVPSALPTAFVDLPEPPQPSSPQQGTPAHLPTLLPALVNPEPPAAHMGTPKQGRSFSLVVQHLKDAQRTAQVPSEELESGARLLEEKLGTFGVQGRVLSVQSGPVVHVYEFEPAPGIKVTRVLSLQDDLALALKAQGILMYPQLGKSTIGIEVPSSQRETVFLKDLLESPSFKESLVPLPMALGKRVDGSPLVADLSAMPHLLVAGSTGSGKSVGINTILLSLLASRSPQELRLILIDPKMLELSTYDGIGHLLLPVVTEPTRAASALRWAIDEMENRYRLMKEAQVRNIQGFNAKAKENGGYLTLGEQKVSPLPYIVIVVDELCDLMMTAPRDVEDSIQRLAQKARASGIHLILATQRPSVDVLTGVIKANLPCRMAFQVASRHDSRTIIEAMGAERLLGKGDMLFLPPGTSRLMRGHGAFVSDSEIASATQALTEIYPQQIQSNVLDQVERTAREMQKRNETKDSGSATDALLDEDELYQKSLDFAFEQGQVSTSSVQRQFRIGYNKAARIVDRMVAEGVVGQADVPGKPRPILRRNA